MGTGKGNGHVLELVPQGVRGKCKGCARRGETESELGTNEAGFNSYLPPSAN